MRSFFRKLFIGEWNIGVCNQDFIALFSKVNQGGALQLDVKWMCHHYPNSFYADPFISRLTDARAYILAEEFFFDTSKGVITLLEIDRRNAKLLNKRVVLEETCHLSYPFYDEAYKTFIPESFRNGNWAEYIFDGRKVSNKHIITDLPLIDATPVEYNGKWYVFATTQPNALDELLIYWSENREGPYKPHTMNPVKRDIKTSRCGGKFFEYNGDLYRPVQDSTHRYGETMHIMRVTKLTPTEFEEDFYCDVIIHNPGKYPLGFHTLNFQEDVIIVDGFRERFSPLQTIYNIKVAPLINRFRYGKH